MSFWRAGFWRAGFWRGGYWRGMGVGAGVVQPLVGRQITAVAGSAGVGVAVDLVGGRTTLAQGTLIPSVVSSGTVVLNGLGLVARAGTFQIGEQATDYFVYCGTPATELVAAAADLALFAVTVPETNTPVVLDLESFVRSALDADEMQDEPVECWVQTAPIAYVHLQATAELWVTAVPEALTATADSSDEVVQVPAPELLAA